MGGESRRPICMGYHSECDWLNYKDCLPMKKKNIETKLSDRFLLIFHFVSYQFHVVQECL